MKPITAGADLVGRTFGFLGVVEHLGRVRPHHHRYLCVCVCGVEREVPRPNLVSGNTKSCGCMRWTSSTGHRYRANQTYQQRHGKSGTRAYHSWFAMNQRCTNPSNENYKYYGARGITVCARWKLFENFYADMGDPPPGLTIDRGDANGNYEKSNCRWATPTEQNRNTRKNVFITFNGERRCLAEWAHITGISRETIGNRHRAGWTPERILTTPGRQP